MTSFVVFVVCSVRSSTANCSGWTQNWIRKHQGNITQDGVSSLVTQECAKSCSKLKETSFLRIFYESVELRSIWFVWRVFLESCKQAYYTIYAIKIMQWTPMLYSGEQRSVYLWGKFFWCCFQPLFRRYNFLCGLLFQKPTLHRAARTSIDQRNAQKLTKEQL